MELGFPVNYFTLDDPTLGQLDTGGYLDGTLLGDDVSPYVQDLTINRGRTDQLASFQAGTANIVLLNNDRRFDPINESSPYWDPVTGRTGIQPRRKVTVTFQGETVFTGRITDLDVQYDLGPNQTSNVTISAADDFVTLATLFTEQEYTPTAELSGARVEYVLDLPEVSFSATARDIDGGTAALGDYTIAANTNVLNYLQRVEKAEQGFLFIDRAGDLTFTDRVGASFVTPSGYFNDDGTDLPFTNLSTVAGQEFFYNKVVTKRETGTEQIADSATSQAEFGILTLSLTDLLLETDGEALTLADALLAKYAEPSYRFDVVTVDLHALDAANRAIVNALDLADVINITRNFVTGSPATVSLDFSIDRIRHRVTPATHIVEIGLAAVQVLYPFTLDDALYGILDASNALT
jgi:hypothetical protein